MKNLILLSLIILGFSFISKSHAYETVSGELAINGNVGFIYSQYGQKEVRINSVEASCFDGLYKVLNGQLVEVVFCRDKGSVAQRVQVEKVSDSSSNDKGFFDTKANFCPLFYVPVCGVVSGKPVTFGNECELTRSGATKVATGSCDTLKAVTVGFKKILSVNKL
tara:strand:- start:138 stop:632 length:495 start_codon:yes stop_codon:yes gene_type:complete